MLHDLRHGVIPHRLVAQLQEMIVHEGRKNEHVATAEREGGGEGERERERGT